MSGYKPVQECAALLDALEAELLAVPEEEVRAALADEAKTALAPWGGVPRRLASAADQAIAAALEGDGLPTGPLPPNGFLFLAAPKGH